MPYRVTVVFGTRPEAIKLAPVILALRADKDFVCRICVTGQHRQMLDQVLQLFSIKPDLDLNLMRQGQSLGALTSRMMESLDSEFANDRPDLVLAQGDTTTAFCAALAAFYHRIPVGHVEAGLRTGNLDAPWPEEANRVLMSRIATLHFAPTAWARRNLMREGVPANRIHVTGNTVVDALLWVRRRLATSGECPESVRFSGLPDNFLKFLILGQNRPSLPADHPRFILVTGHRRESFGPGFERICQAIREVADSTANVHIAYPVHLNPNVQEPVHRVLGNHSRIALIPPLSYEAFVWLMDRAWLVLTDSGGVQEEAPTLGKPVLVMRETTERPEGVEAGTSLLVGTDPKRIVAETLRLLDGPVEYSKRSQIRNPYGDGAAASLIVRVCSDVLSASGRSHSAEQFVTPTEGSAFDDVVHLPRPAIATQESTVARLEF
jgi:UDP-N-acetylglucosamine 2-epimerase (non-hydrolysing)